jgi:hypothetical protein
MKYNGQYGLSPKHAQLHRLTKAASKAPAVRDLLSCAPAESGCDEVDTESDVDTTTDSYEDIQHDSESKTKEKANNVAIDDWADSAEDDNDSGVDVSTEDYVGMTPAQSKRLTSLLTEEVTEEKGDTRSQLSDIKVTDKFNNVQISIKYDPKNPTDFFERFKFETSQVDPALHFDKLKTCLSQKDLSAVTEAFFEHCKRTPAYRDLKPRKKAVYAFTFAEDWLCNRDKIDKTVDSIKEMTKFNGLKQGNSKEPIAVQRFILALQESQRKLGSALCSDEQLRIRFLTGMNLALRRNVMMQPRYESYDTKKLFKAADKLWRASVKATNFGGGDTEEKFVTEDKLELKLNALVQKKKPWLKKHGNGDGKNDDKKNNKGKPLDPSSKFLPTSHMVDKTFLPLYSKEDREARLALRKANALSISKPDLFAKDAWHGKKVCVDCRKVGHHAGECRRTKSRNERQLSLIRSQLEELRKEDAAPTSE